MDHFEETKAGVLQSSRFAQQFRNAVAPGGKVNSEGECEELSAADVLLHYICITWKVRAAARVVLYGACWERFLQSRLEHVDQCGCLKINVGASFVPFEYALAAERVIESE